MDVGLELMLPWDLFMGDMAVRHRRMVMLVNMLRTEVLERVGPLLEVMRCVIVGMVMDEPLVVVLHPFGICHGVSFAHARGSYHVSMVARHEAMDILGKTVHHLVDFPSADLPSHHPEDGPDYVGYAFTIVEYRFCGNSIEELVGGHLLRLMTWVPGLVVDAADEHRQLGTKVGGLLHGETVAECVEDTAQDLVALAPA
jgi:hypothetical protein